MLAIFLPVILLCSKCKFDANFMKLQDSENQEQLYRIQVTFSISFFGNTFYYFQEIHISFWRLFFSSDYTGKERKKERKNRNKRTRNLDERKKENW